MQPFSRGLVPDGAAERPATVRNTQLFITLVFILNESGLESVMRQTAAPHAGNSNFESKECTLASSRCTKVGDKWMVQRTRSLKHKSHLSFEPKKEEIML